jgi:hypothetical protein
LETQTKSLRREIPVDLELRDLHDGLQEYVSWKRRWPSAYGNFDLERMPCETALVFEYALHTEVAERKSQAMLAAVVRKNAEELSRLYETDRR